MESIFFRHITVNDSWKVKIGVVLPEIEVFSEKNSGAIARWIYEVYGFFQKKDVYIFSPKSTNSVYNQFNVHQVPTFYGIEKKKFPWFNLGHHLKYNYYPVAVAIRARLLRLDLLHIHNRYSYVPLIKMIFPKVKIILHLHNDHLLYITDLEFKGLMGKAELIVGCSDYVCNGITNRMDGLGLSGSLDVLTIYNGADLEKFTVSEDYFYRHSLQNILFVGRLLPEKGVLELIKAFRKLVSSRLSKATLTIIGAGSFTKNNQKSEYDYQLSDAASGIEDRINFTGLIDNNKLSGYMKKASVFVCPSTWNEPFGIVITEAMAAGLPIIASNRGGIPEIVDEAGILIDPEDVDELANALGQLLDDRIAAQKYAKMGYQRFMKKFNWGVIASQWQSILNGQFKMNLLILKELKKVTDK